MHLEHRPAEQTFSDYAGDKLYYYDPASGAAVACPIFVSELPFSGYAYIEAQHSQRTDATGDEPHGSVYGRRYRVCDQL